MLDPSPWPKEAQPFVKRVAQWIQNSLIDAKREPLADLASDIYNYHCVKDHVAQALRQGPAQRLEDIPAIPVQLYKDLAVGTIKDDDGVMFLTSGTTQSRRGAHRMHHPSLYELGATLWAHKCVPSLPKIGTHLLLDPIQHPTSSLSHMIHALTPKDPSWHLLDGKVDHDGFLSALTLAQGPIFVGATAFALADAIQHMNPVTLHPQSVLMITGGFKGRHMELSDADLFREASRCFPNIRIVTEYGMTELSSQLWGTPGAPYRPPPWMRVWACDPLTGNILPDGHTGQLRFFDLANVDSALVIETMDRGIILADGTVSLLGRLTDSSPRGCSLTVEEAYATEAST